MKTKLLWTLLAILAVFLPGCSDDDESPAQVERLQLVLPASVDIPAEGTLNFTLSEPFAFGDADDFMFEATTGVSYICKITAKDNSSVSIKLDKGVGTGNYKVYCRHAGRKMPLGTMFVNIVESIEFTPDEGTTIYGKITDGDQPVAGVVVSDGVEVAKTDEQGIFQLKSEKYFGYVFVSVPSGYEAIANGCFPEICKYTHGKPSEAERVDFQLKKKGNQDSYKLLVLGDMHLANRTSDLQQFASTTKEISSFAAANNTYAITLGDMTWDIYWASNSFGLSDYVALMNKSVSGLQIYHTMGNHDNEYTATSDFAAEEPYRRILAPTYYSFNIGQVHYVALDDIDCSNYDGTTSRNYAKSITKLQLDWLRKDLAMVDAEMPVIVSMHAPVFKPRKNTTAFNVDLNAESAGELLSILSGRKVHFITGHTHMNYNITPQCETPINSQVYEHNFGAVCGSWWWSGYLSDGLNLCTDGTPAGYGIWEINGKDIKYIYKGTGYDENHQFRAYDLNQVKFTMDDVPNFPSNAPADVKKSLDTYLNAYTGKQTNEVLINIWNWNPAWTVKVTTESGTALNVTPTWAYDPLHIAALTLKRFNSSSIKSIPNFITEYYTHFFKVTAPDADSDLTIEVSDEFGHKWTQKMQRPMPFSISAYR